MTSFLIYYYTKILLFCLLILQKLKILFIKSLISSRGDRFLCTKVDLNSENMAIELECSASSILLRAKNIHMKIKTFEK